MPAGLRVGHHTTTTRLHNVCCNNSTVIIHAAKDPCNMKKHLFSCECNTDTAYVARKYTDGTRVFIHVIAVENEIADNMYRRSKLDYRIYNASLEYAGCYWKTVTEYKPAGF